MGVIPPVKRRPAMLVRRPVDRSVHSRERLTIDRERGGNSARREPGACKAVGRYSIPIWFWTA